MCRKLSLIAVVIMLATVSLMAQSQKSDPKERAAELKAKLTLTDDQTAKVEHIYADYDAKAAAQKTAKGTAKVSLKTLRAESEKEINNVLTDVQKAEYKKLLAAKPEKTKTVVKAEKSEKALTAAKAEKSEKTLTSAKAEKTGKASGISK